MFSFLEKKAANSAEKNNGLRAKKHSYPLNSSHIWNSTHILGKVGTRQRNDFVLKHSFLQSHLTTRKTLLLSSNFSIIFLRSAWKHKNIGLRNRPRSPLSRRLTSKLINAREEIKRKRPEKMRRKLSVGKEKIKHVWEEICQRQWICAINVRRFCLFNTQRYLYCVRSFSSGLHSINKTLFKTSAWATVSISLLYENVPKMSWLKWSMLEKTALRLYGPSRKIRGKLTWVYYS